MDWVWDVIFTLFGVLVVSGICLRMNRGRLTVVQRKRMWRRLVALVLLWVTLLSPLPHTLYVAYPFQLRVFQEGILYFLIIPIVLQSLSSATVAQLVWPYRRRRMISYLGHPVTGGIGFLVLYTVMHLPGVVRVLYDGGVLDIGFMAIVGASAVCMWWPVTHSVPGARRMTEGQRLFYLLVLHVALLLITIATFSQYPHGQGAWMTSRTAFVGGSLIIGLQWLVFFSYSAALIHRWHARENVVDSRWPKPQGTK
ncbi:cytochrome c oxidase assembly protein [Aureibacillus halotolerans]|uniref:Caa3-type cytochrome oxidase assembly factor Caa3/CtaG n=1 Tax=Aureibacillus halotolerans TaxID=1508390 RepID=A0A4R6TTW4_9BACI|nr:cytochrome c oxidase assembly protein [Aureibacillus halotolerans]TDQ36761.1 caa3-type cytochrome oxidase assembly factor Caa3/CtaG [Aureibacillus halotolerans]